MLRFFYDFDPTLTHLKAIVNKLSTVYEVSGSVSNHHDPYLIGITFVVICITMQKIQARLKAIDFRKLNAGKAFWLFFKLGILITGVVLVSARIPVVQKDVLNMQVLNNNESELHQSDIKATFSLSIDKVAYIRKDDSRIFLFDRVKNVVTEVISFTADKNLNGLVFYKSSFYVLSETGSVLKVTQKGESQPEVEEFVLPVVTSGKRDGLRLDTVGKRLLIDLGSDSTDDYSRGYYEFPVHTN